MIRLLHTGVDYFWGCEAEGRIASEVLHIPPAPGFYESGSWFWDKNFKKWAIWNMDHCGKNAHTITLDVDSWDTDLKVSSEESEAILCISKNVVQGKH